MRTVLLLIASNLFMTFAWYGHLKYKDSPLWKVVMVSWFIAFFEYCLQVPANRWGHHAEAVAGEPGRSGRSFMESLWQAQFTTSQLKIMQEAITLVVFVAFVWSYMGESPRWNEYAAMGLIFAAVVLANWR